MNGYCTQEEDNEECPKQVAAATLLGVRDSPRHFSVPSAGSTSSTTASSSNNNNDKSNDIQHRTNDEYDDAGRRIVRSSTDLTALEESTSNTIVTVETSGGPSSSVSDSGLMGESPHQNHSHVVTTTTTTTKDDEMTTTPKSSCCFLSIPTIGLGIGDTVIVAAQRAIQDAMSRTPPQWKNLLLPSSSSSTTTPREDLHHHGAPKEEWMEIQLGVPSVLLPLLHIHELDLLSLGIRSSSSIRIVPGGLLVEPSSSESSPIISVVSCVTVKFPVMTMTTTMMHPTTTATPAATTTTMRSYTTSTSHLPTTTATTKACMLSSPERQTIDHYVTPESSSALLPRSTSLPITPLSTEAMIPSQPTATTSLSSSRSNIEILAMLSESLAMERISDDDIRATTTTTTTTATKSAPTTTTNRRVSSALSNSMMIMEEEEEGRRRGSTSSNTSSSLIEEDVVMVSASRGGSVVVTDTIMSHNDTNSYQRNENTTTPNTTVTSPNTILPKRSQSGNAGGGGKTMKNHQRIFVKHQYQDYSQEEPSPEEQVLQFTPISTSAAFPLKLHETLSAVEKDGLSSIFGWLPHGRAFKVLDTQQFNDLILPRYFVMSKKSSFLRQLNLYGFHRLSAGPDQGAYYHALFLRSKKFLCKRISRQKINGNRIRSAGNPEEEPPLTSYPSLPPIPVIGF